MLLNLSAGVSQQATFSFFLSLAISLCLGGYTYATVFQFARPQAAAFRLRGVCACRHYLSVSGPLDFRLVIQVLLRPCMILNACVHRRHPCLTSLAEDVALPQEQYTHIHTAHARAGNRTRTVVWGGRRANRYTIGPATCFHCHILFLFIIVICKLVSDFKTEKLRLNKLIA